MIRNFGSLPGRMGLARTSIYDNADIEDFGRSVWIINPDALAKRIRDIERMDPVPANVEAVQRIERWLYSSIDAHQAVGVETVLSTPKYRFWSSRRRSEDLRSA
jgi:predicted ABC-type ATPase